MPKYKYPGVFKHRKKWYYRIQHNLVRVCSNKGYDTALEAKLARAEHTTRLHKQSFQPAKIKLTEFIVKYLKEYAKPRNRSSTLKKTDGICRNHIIPNLGNMKMQDIKPFHIVQFQKYMIENKTTSVAYNTMRTLRKLLNRAVKWEFIPYSPIKETLPPAPDNEHPILTLDQVFNIVDNLEGRDKYIVALISFAALRPGEIFGLKWEDFNFIENTIHLCRQYTDGEIAPIKARKGRGIILPIWSKLTIMMMDWKQQSGSQVWVFKGRGNKPMSHDGWRCDEWQRIKKRFELPDDFRFYDLRHTFASVMLAEGAPLGDVQKLMRHKTYQITADTYRHLLPGQLEKNFRIFDFRSGNQSGNRSSVDKEI